jgi:hypothetical protein
LERRRERDNRSVARSGGEQLELLGQRWLRIAGILRLLFARHVSQLDATQDHSGSDNGLETEHRPDAPLDSAMILLNPIVQVGTLPDANGLQITPCSILEPIGSIAGEDRFTIGLAAIDHNPLGPPMPLERLAQDPLRGCQIAPLAELEFNRVAVAIDCSVQIPPVLSR